MLAAALLAWPAYGFAQAVDTKAPAPANDFITWLCRGLPQPGFIPSASDPKKCAATIYLGQQNNTGEDQMFGLSKFVPPYQYKLGDSYFIGGSLSRVIAEFGDLAAFEIETGVGQRFGSLHEEEVWLALYGRWKYFPWNNYLLTTVAASTGLSYASGVPAYEIADSGINRGQRLLHYLSPEITFALPSHPDTLLVIRNQHRSGGGGLFGDDVPLYGSMFHGIQGGVQYLTVGLRQHF